MNAYEHSLHIKKRVLVVMLGCLLLIAFLVSSSYRGIAHDEGLSGFAAGARRIVAHKSIFYLDAGEVKIKAPARLVYIALIAIGYKLFGINLVALHIFPYVLQIINPCLFFIVLSRLFKSCWWGFAGAILFIFHPFALVYLNQQHNHPICVFLLLLMLLMFDRSLKNPKWLLVFGILASLLILTRFEDGVIYVTALYGAYILHRWKNGIPITWLIFSLGMMVAIYVICAVYFEFPLSYYYKHYWPAVMKRQELKAGELSFYELTKQGIRIFVYWYFCGKFMAPFLFILSGIGIFVYIRKRIFYPIAIFLPHFLFFTLVYNGRNQVNALPMVTLSIPGFILLFLSGIMVIYDSFPSLLSRLKRSAHKVGAMRFLQQSVSVGMIIIILGFFGRAAYSLAIIVEDSQPASTMWRIVKYNPPLPGNPSYKDAYIQLSQKERLPVRLREELYKAVRGNYRSWYIHRVGERAFERGLPEQARDHADFSYVDDYESKDRWEKDRFAFEGPSPLWNKKFPGRLGAFPLGESGSFVYKFEFPKPIDYVIISDIHTQWGFGDIIKMWTSTDGEQWTLRYDNWNVRYTKDRYYQYFEDEFDGYTSLLIKYYFHAGDKTRTGKDNRGASLQEFSLAVKYVENGFSF